MNDVVTLADRINETMMGIGRAISGESKTDVRTVVNLAIQSSMHQGYVNALAQQPNIERSDRLVEVLRNLVLDCEQACKMRGPSLRAAQDLLDELGEL